MSVLGDQGDELCTVVNNYRIAGFGAGAGAGARPSPLKFPCSTRLAQFRVAAPLFWRDLCCQLDVFSAGEHLPFRYYPRAVWVRVTLRDQSAWPWQEVDIQVVRTAEGAGSGKGGGFQFVVRRFFFFGAVLYCVILQCL